MEWDLGFTGIGTMILLAAGFGLAAVLLSGHALGLRHWSIAGLAVFVVGLMTSEVWFGWATEEELQPNIDGLSFDEALLSSFVTTVAIVVVMRRLASRGRGPSVPHGI